MTIVLGFMAPRPDMRTCTEGITNFGIKPYAFRWRIPYQVLNPLPEGGRHGELHESLQ